MVINVGVSAANSTPACPPLTPAIKQLLIASLTALLECSMAFVLSLWSLELKTTPASAAPSMWLAGVDGVAGIGTEPFRSRANSLLGTNWRGSKKAVNHGHM